ncbi:hypothetical protein BDW02DRAFT_604192 [Decorospora gaudefroyi]|uniref:RING-type domain-containing protein n=1 Tax=Decorospora gaudefroyi TaxID=184978 RepID=A0A6A5KXY3_9PLEO|nr:hypothetical protein BDW02DRAFT_604192 [Decorospora gaudefroyi]
MSGFGLEFVLIAHISSQLQPPAAQHGSDKTPSRITQKYPQTHPKNRKAIEGECSICSEEVAGFAKLCYCDACGQNFHSNCLQDWLSRQKTCAMCRSVWMSLPDNLSERGLEDGDTDSFDFYMQWLYTRDIPIGPVDKGKHHRGLRLLFAHVLGEKLEDIAFLQAIRKEIVDDPVEWFLLPFVVWNVYRDTSPKSVFRKFLVDLYAVMGEPRWLAGLRIDKYAAEFTIDLAQALMSRRQNPEADIKQALAEYLPAEEPAQAEE